MPYLLREGEVTTEYIDIADLPPQRWHDSLSKRLKAIPEGKAVSLPPNEGESLLEAAHRVSGIAHKQGIKDRRYRTRTDLSNGCIWVWWEPREKEETK